MSKSDLLRDGFCVFPNVFESDFVDEIRVKFDKALDESPHKPTIYSPHIHASLSLRPAYLKVYSHPEVIRILRDELGCEDLKHWSTYIFKKEPGNSRWPWHYDWSSWDESLSRQDLGPQLGVYFYYSSAEGVIEVLPRSHREWWLDYFQEERHWFAPHPKGILLNVKPGDLIVIDARTLVASQPNNGISPLIMSISWYFTNWQAMSDGFRATRGVRDKGCPGNLVELCPECPGDVPPGYYERPSPVKEDMR